MLAVQAEKQVSLSQAGVQLLLLTSRPALTGAQQAAASSLTPKVADWAPFMDTALRKHALPMVYNNLARQMNSPPPDEALAMLRLLSVRATATILQRHAAFDWFHENCIIPSGVTYAYLKGPALAARFYPDPTQRFFRDVDILVPRPSRGALLRFLQDRGCRVIHLTERGSEFPDLQKASALAEYLFVTPVPHVLTPQGLVVELHPEIDLQTSLFDTAELLAKSIEMPTKRHIIKVLPDIEHVVFTFYHHSRHLWSKLNWVADLDAICNHPRLDLAAASECARKLKIDSTFAAALELHQLTAAGHYPTDSDPASPGLDLLRACIDGLPGDLALEQEMRKGQRLNVIGFAWQPMPVSAWRHAWLRLRKFRPTYEDLQYFPHGRIPRYAAAGLLRLSRGIKSLVAHAWR